MNFRSFRRLFLIVIAAIARKLSSAHDPVVEDYNSSLSRATDRWETDGGAIEKTETIEIAQKRYRSIT
ncbi:MAG: hypothetical protein R3A80_07750 [Bdellovibrionota bacterium]